MNNLIKEVENLLNCCELNLDDMEENTIKQIKTVRKELNKLDKNTIYQVQMIDAEALKESLSKILGENKVEFRDLGKYDALVFTYDRYAMDGNGYHVGYETYTATITIIYKSNLVLLEYHII